MTTTEVLLPKIKHKSFTYNTSLSWTSDKSGVASSAGKIDLQVSSPPEFKGEPGLWTPEDFLVAAVETCLMTTFMSFARRVQLAVNSYESDAEGLLEFTDGSYRFTRIILRPTITVLTSEALSLAEQALHNAHASCLIANSLNGEVIVEPSIRLSE